jgi:hypothetical protein
VTSVENAKKCFRHWQAAQKTESERVWNSVVRNEKEQSPLQYKRWELYIYIYKQLLLLLWTSCWGGGGIVCIDWCCSSLSTYRDRSRHWRQPFWIHRLPAGSRNSTYAFMASWHQCFQILTLNCIRVLLRLPVSIPRHVSLHSTTNRYPSSYDKVAISLCVSPTLTVGYSASIHPVPSFYQSFTCIAIYTHHLLYRLKPHFPHKIRIHNS